MVRIAVLLSGCGQRDGAEIHEAVMTLFGLGRTGAITQCVSRDAPQKRVVNHITGTPTEESRNMMVEAARIARGRVIAVSEADPDSFDGAVIVGGLGTAFNFCDFASRGEDMTVESDVAGFLRRMHSQGKPLGAVCIAPVILARLFGSLGCRITLGGRNDAATKAERMGAQVVECAPTECVTDEDNRLVTTPAYMSAGSVVELTGIWRLAEEVTRMARERKDAIA